MRRVLAAAELVWVWCISRVHADLITDVTNLASAITSQQQALATVNNITNPATSASQIQQPTDLQKEQLSYAVARTVQAWELAANRSDGNYNLWLQQGYIINTGGIGLLHVMAHAVASCMPLISKLFQLQATNWTSYQHALLPYLLNDNYVNSTLAQLYLNASLHFNNATTAASRWPQVSVGQMDSDAARLYEPLAQLLQGYNALAWGVQEMLRQGIISPQSNQTMQAPLQFLDFAIDAVNDAASNSLNSTVDELLDDVRTQADSIMTTVDGNLNAAALLCWNVVHSAQQDILNASQALFGNCHSVQALLRLSAQDAQGNPLLGSLVGLTAAGQGMAAAIQSLLSSTPRVSSESVSTTSSCGVEVLRADLGSEAPADFTDQLLHCNASSTLAAARLVPTWQRMWLDINQGMATAMSSIRRMTGTPSTPCV